MEFAVENFFDYLLNVLNIFIESTSYIKSYLLKKLKSMC